MRCRPDLNLSASADICFAHALAGSQASTSRADLNRSRCADVHATNETLDGHADGQVPDSAGRHHDVHQTGSHHDDGAPKPPPRFRIAEVPTDFLSSDESRNKLLGLISSIEHVRKTQQEINKIYDDLLETYIEEMRSRFVEIRTAPGSQRKFRFSKKEWWDEELTCLFKDMQKAEHQYIMAKKKQSPHKELRHIFKLKQDRFDKILKRKKRNFQKLKCLHIEQVNSSDPNIFWDYIKKLGPKKSSHIPWECYSDNGDIVYNTNEVLDKWRDEFSSLYSPSLENITTEQLEFKEHIKAENEKFEKNPCDISPTINIPFTVEEVVKVIGKSKNNKAPGIDGIVYDVLKNEPSAIVMTALFNMCFETHLVPDIWVQALIHPIPKSSLNDPRIPLNYRGISLLSVISKLYTSALNTRLNGYLESNEFIVNEQNGFRADRSCLDHIFVLHNTLRIRNQLNNHTFCAFIDFKKAFDLVDRDALLYKLRNIGISGNFYYAIKSLYANAKSCVRVNDKVTTWFDVTSGVRQGDSLSPTLFSVFLNDLAQEIKDTDSGVMISGLVLSILLYADDIVLLAPTPEKLQNMLDVVSRWCEKWGMQINVNKTQIMHVRNHQRPRSTFQFNCGGAPLAYTDSYKYLGVILHEHLTNTKTANTLAAAASRSFGRVHSIFKSIGNMGINSYETLYESYVDSIMNYASAVWGFVITMHPRFCRIVLCVFILVSINLLPFLLPKLKWTGLNAVKNDG